MNERLLAVAIREHIHQRGRGRCCDACAPWIARAYERLQLIEARYYADRADWERHRREVLPYLL